MEWLTGIRTAISFIEDNLKEDISVQDVAGKVFIYLTDTVRILKRNNC